MKKYFALILLLNILTFSALYSQSTDSINSDDDWKVEFKFDSFRQPRIDLSYGFTTPFYHEDAYKGDLSPANMLELKLGFENSRPYRNSETVFKYSTSNFFIANISEMSTKRDNADFAKVRTEAWRFGFNGSKGYGYELGSGMKLAMGNSNGIGWTKLDFLDSAQTPADQNSLDYFGDALRFGTQTEGNLTLKFNDKIGISGSYERAVVFPRFMFWYWAGSVVVKEATSGLLGEFVKEIGKVSPSSVPVVNFVLMNAFNFGYYEILKHHMNWPIYTEPPYMFDTFKISANINF